MPRLIYAKCDKGSMENKLNLPKDHGVVYGEPEFPLMNANDHVPKKHMIVDFCSSSGVDASPDATVALENNAASFEAAYQAGRGAGTGGTRQAGVSANPNSMPSENNLPPSSFASSGDTFSNFQDFGGEYAAYTGYPGTGGFVASPAFNGMIPDFTTIGIANGSAGIPGLNFFEEMSIQNLVHNRAQMILPDALDILGNITDISRLANFNLGNTVFSAIDCGGAAIYNVMNMLGNPPNLSDIIFRMEQYALKNLLPLGGPLVSTAANMVDYMARNGIDTEILVRTGKEVATMLGGQLPSFAGINIPTQLPMDIFSFPAGIGDMIGHPALGTPPFVPGSGDFSGVGQMSVGTPPFVPGSTGNVRLPSMPTPGGIIGSIPAPGANPSFVPMGCGSPTGTGNTGQFMRFPDDEPQIFIKF